MKSNSLYDLIVLITDIQSILLIICCLLCFLFIQRMNTCIKVFSYYLFFMLIISSVAREMSTKSLNNLPLLHILTLGEFIFLSSLYKLILNNTFFHKYFKYYLAIVGGLIIANTYYLEPVDTFNTNGKILVQSINIIFATMFFYERAIQLMEVNIHEKALRLINSALLIYYSGSFFVFLFYKFTWTDEQFYSQEILVYNASLYLIFTILILIAILMVVFHHKKAPIPK